MRQYETILIDALQPFPTQSENQSLLPLTIMRATTSGTQTNFTLLLISAQPFAQRQPRDAKTPAHRPASPRVRYARTQLRRRTSARFLSSINKDHLSLMRLLCLWG